MGSDIVKTVFSRFSKVKGHLDVSLLLVTKMLARCSGSLFVGNAQNVAPTLRQIVIICSNAKKNSSFFASKPHCAFEEKATKRPESTINLLRF